jgi:hypothetical protein
VRNFILYVGCHEKLENGGNAFVGLSGRLEGMRISMRIPVIFTNFVLCLNKIRSTAGFLLFQGFNM